MRANTRRWILINWCRIKNGGLCTQIICSNYKEISLWSCKRWHSSSFTRRRRDPNEHRENCRWIQQANWIPLEHWTGTRGITSIWHSTSQRLGIKMMYRQNVTWRYTCLSVDQVYWHAMRIIHTQSSGKKCATYSSARLTTNFSTHQVLATFRTYQLTTCAVSAWILQWLRNKSSS